MALVNKRSIQGNILHTTLGGKYRYHYTLPGMVWYLWYRDGLMWCHDDYSSLALTLFMGGTLDIFINVMESINVTLSRALHKHTGSIFPRLKNI